MHCKNCSHALKDGQKYCDNCGAKVIYNRLTPKVLTHQINEQFLSIDNKFLRTFIHLFTQPTEVINGFINGTRKKYINVVQYLAISITLLGIQYFIINTIDASFFQPEPSALDAELAKLYPPEALEQMEKLTNKANEYMSLIYLIGLPASALITWIVFLKEGIHNFTEHMVINIYVTAQYIIYSALLYLLFFTLNIEITVLLGIAMLSYIIYNGYVFFKLYKLKILTLFLRFLYAILLFGILTIVLTIITVIVLVIYMKLTT